MSPRMGQKLTDNPKSKRIQVRMDEETVEKLDYFTERFVINRSEFIRSGIEKRYFELKLKEELEMKEGEFVKCNLENKIPFLQDEHKFLIKILYDNACKMGAIKDEKFDKCIGQSISYTEIKEIIKEDMTDKVLSICLNDLENMDFILNTMANPYKEAQYGIKPLGLEYIKYCKK